MNKNRIEEIKNQISALQEELDNLLIFPGFKSGYRMTTRNGEVLICLEVNTEYYTGLCLINPIKDTASWNSLRNYKGSKNSYSKDNDVIKVEKLYHPYSVFYPYMESRTEVIWEEVWKS